MTIPPVLGRIAEARQGDRRGAPEPGKSPSEDLRSGFPSGSVRHQCIEPARTPNFRCIPDSRHNLLHQRNHTRLISWSQPAVQNQSAVL